jgi:signal transduction histidine kinase
MNFFKAKLKTQLTIINAISKVAIILIAVFVLPLIVRTISIREMDNQLINKLDQVYLLIEDLGIEEFIDVETNPMGFGSYNILKEEYVSIEVSPDTTLSEYIESTQRIIDEEILNYRIISATFEYDGYFYLLEIGKSTAAIMLFEKNLKNYTFLFLIILLTLSIIFDLTITQILLRPFELIIKKLKSNTHPSSFNYSKTITPTSDFKYLEDSVHQLMKKIENVFNEEREYIGNISHEILTPVSIIKSKLENFSDSTNLSHEDAIKIYQIKITLGRLTKLVRSLLLLSRIENREYLIDDSVQINEVILDISDEIKERIEIKEISLDLELCRKDFQLAGNRELIHMMIYNLINNAIRYTPENGNIKIRTIRSSGNYSIIIKDSGAGISKEDLPYIFDRFKKYKSGTNNFGLGLALVKKICDYHKIEIIVNSELKKGTAFTLIFKK